MANADHQPLSDDQVEAVAAQLARAEATRTPIESLVHEPVGVDDGYRIQTAGHRLHGDDLTAWKAGCTNEAVQEMLRIDAPVLGRYRRDHVLTSPAALAFDDFATPPHLEVEVGLRLLDDIDSVPDDPLELADLVEAFAAIEVVAGRLAAFPLVGASQLVADNVVGGRMIVGSTLDLTSAGLRALDTVLLELVIDDERVASGTGAEAMGHPLRVLRAAAEHALASGRPLRAGQLVITGTCTGLVPAERGREHVGRVGGVEVGVRFD